MNTKAGTPNYIAPEVLTGSYDVGCDLWSAGCILYILICGLPPFYGDTDAEVLDMVRRCDYNFEGKEWSGASTAVTNLISRLICKPEKRLTAAEALKHKWFKINKPANTKLSCDVVKDLDGLRQFPSHTLMKRICLNAISSQVAPKDVVRLQNLFQQLDKDSNGALDLTEIAKGLQSLLPNQGAIDNAKLLRMFEAADLDGSGSLDYNEFIAATISEDIYLREDYITAAFHMLDLDGSGKIDVDEIVKLLQGDNAINTVNKQAIQLSIAEIDQNGDGEIDMDEFIMCMAKETEVERQYL